MKDNLENFVRTNRGAFDQAQPDLRVWAGIDKALGSPPSRRVPLWRRSLSIAASVLFLIGLGTFIGWQLNQGATAQSLAEMHPELQEMKEYYEAELQEKKALLASHQADPSVNEDLSQLEGFLKELQSELAEAPRGQEEQIVNAMIENYQDRLEILERVLSRIQSNQQTPQNLNNDESISL